MLTISCDRCGREISDADADVDGIRVLVKRQDKRYKDEYIYISIGPKQDDDDDDDDDESESNEAPRHYCLSCVQFLLDRVLPAKDDEVDEKPAVEEEGGTKSVNI